MHSVGSKICAKASVVAAELDDQMVLLDIDTGVYYGLDPVGKSIWSLATSGTSEEDMFNALLAEYEVEADRLRADLSEFLARIQEHGLVYTTS